MSDLPPATLLREAATRIRQLAEAEGTWAAWRYDDRYGFVRDSDDDVVCETSDGNGQWIAAMGPQLAEPLAAWLENTADWIESGEPCPCAEALVVARLVLAQSAPTDKDHDG